MSQSKSYANAAGAVKTLAYQLSQGSGKANIASNNTSLVTNATPGSFIPGGMAIGQFPVTQANKANTTGESAKVHGLGWAVRRAWEGPVLTVAAANGSLFANGETVLLSNGSANGTVVITANATGNLVSGVVSVGGLFPNASEIVTTFTREKHVANLNFSNSTALTGVGNANVINFTIGNTNISYGVSAKGSITSNSTGGITNSITQAVTWGANSGLYAAAQTNTAVTVVFTNANGTIVGGTFTATANLVTSTGGVVNGFVLGGRAGRVTYEILDTNRHIGIPLNSIYVTGGSAYTNTDFIRVTGGGLTNASHDVATATISTNSIGGFANVANLSSNLTITSVGKYPNNAALTVTVYAANGAASNGSGATLTANLQYTVANSFQLPSS